MGTKRLQIAFCISTLAFFVTLIILMTKEPDFQSTCQLPYVPMNAYFVRPYNYEQQVAALPDLSKLQWPIGLFAKSPAGRRNASGHVLPLPPALKPVMSPGQRELFDQLLTVFTELMFSHGYGDRFMLHAGTLLGTFRHHDIVPWDDDIDLLVDNKIRSEVQTLMKTLEPNYNVHIQRHRDKLCARILNDTIDDDAADVLLSRRASQYSWGWPYLDIAYYETNLTHLWDLNVVYGHPDIWPRSAVFPLRFRPLGPRWFPTPNDIDQVVNLAFTDPTGTCAQHGYSHVLEGGGPSGKMPCRALKEAYAFVERHSQKCLWTRGYSEKVVQEIVVEQLDTRQSTSPVHIIYTPIDEKR